MHTSNRTNNSKSQWHSTALPHYRDTALPQLRCAALPAQLLPLFFGRTAFAHYRIAGFAAPHIYVLPHCRFNGSALLRSTALTVCRSCGLPACSITVGAVILFCCLPPLRLTALAALLNNALPHSTNNKHNRTVFLSYCRSERNQLILVPNSANSFHSVFRIDLQVSLQLRQTFVP